MNAKTQTIDTGNPYLVTYWPACVSENHHIVALTEAIHGASGICELLHADASLVENMAAVDYEDGLPQPFRATTRVNLRCALRVCLDVAMVRIGAIADDLADEKRSADKPKKAVTV
jgi:hypothetical protein